MRILFISAEPVRSRQATATHVNEIAKGLRSLGHDLTTCVTQVMGPYERTSVPRRCFAYMVFWLQALRLLRQTDLVYSRAHFANFPIALAARLLRIPIVHEINGTYQDVSITHSWMSSFMRLVAAIYRFQFRKADALIPVTSGLADWVRWEAPGVPVHVVPNGVNPSVFHRALLPVRAVTRDYALFFGSLTRWHGIETIIAAIDHDHWPSDLDLVIVGDGQLVSMVREAAERNTKIHALKSVPQDVLAGYIRAAFVGLVPLNTVGGRGKFGLSPLKLFEMLACGLPVIVTDFPGQAELVRSLDAGLIVPPDDPAALAQAVATLRQKPLPPEKMLEVAAVIETEHGWDSRVAETNRILGLVVDKARF